MTAPIDALMPRSVVFVSGVSGVLSLSHQAGEPYYQIPSGFEYMLMVSSKATAGVTLQRSQALAHSSRVKVETIAAGKSLTIPSLVVEHGTTCYLSMLGNIGAKETVTVRLIPIELVTS